MKHSLTLILSVFIVSFYSCEKLDNTVPETPVQDSIEVINGKEYFIQGLVGDSTIFMKANTDNVGNGILKEELTSCGLGIQTQVTSYFAYVSDTTRKEWVGFGLNNCVSDSADGFSDSTYIPGSYPMEISLLDTASSFLLFMDRDSSLWSSALGQNGLIAQMGHGMNISEVTPCYDGIAALRVKGNISGWVYNIDGDSMLITVSDFYTRAWPVN